MDVFACVSGGDPQESECNGVKFDKFEKFDTFDFPNIPLVPLDNADPAIHLDSVGNLFPHLEDVNAHH